MLKNLRKKYLKKKVRKYSKAVKYYQNLSNEYRTMGDSTTSLYCDYKAANLMYKEAVIIDKLVRT